MNIATAIMMMIMTVVVIIVMAFNIMTMKINNIELETDHVICYKTFPHFL